MLIGITMFLDLKNNINKNTLLICKSIWYYTSTDEDLFFTWLKKIKCIKKIDGRLDELYLHISSHKISDNNLVELIALFYRYKVDMKQLQIFLNNKNKAWFFDNKRAYWHRRVFGATKKCTNET